MGTVGRSRFSAGRDGRRLGRSLWRTYLPGVEVERRGAATSLPLPFPARALESAALASRYHER